MAEDIRLAQVQACRLRVTRLTATGAPATGATAMYVTDAMVQLTIAPVYTDGDEFEQKNGCGDLYVNYRGLDSFKRADVTIQLASPDPELSELLSEGSILDGTTVTGFAAPAIGVGSGDAISVEAWTKRIKDGQPDIENPYGWWAIPKITNLRLSDYTLQNGVMLPQFSGQAYENANWASGPEGDFPVASDRVFQWIPTATLPAAVEGYQTL